MAVAAVTGADLQVYLEDRMHTKLPLARCDSVVAGYDQAALNTQYLTEFDNTYNMYQWDEVSPVNGMSPADVKQQYPNDGPYVLQEDIASGYVVEIHLLARGTDVNQWITDFKNDWAQTKTNAHILEGGYQQTRNKLGLLLDREWDLL